MQTGKQTVGKRRGVFPSEIPPGKRSFEMMKKLIVACCVLAVAVFASSAFACDKPCTGKSAKTVADKSGCSKPCGESAKTVADKSGCPKPCGKSAKTVADKSGEGCPHAKDAKSGCPESCLKSGVKLTADKSEGCPIRAKAHAILSSMPKITYQIGEEKTCCGKTAAKAREEGKVVKYWVGDESFDTEVAAKKRLVSLLEAEVEQMKTVQYSVNGETVGCPKSASHMAEQNGGKVAYRVAGFDFDNQEKAEKAVKLVKAAADDVKMSYKVGDKTFCCDKMAGAESSKNGEKMHYVVGEEETGCAETARLMLTEAKAQAMVEAAASVYAS
jgi:hypothetical protein